MRLLVSVRSAAEATVALAGGADIIDAKEPSRGSLGPVSPDTLGQILDCIPVQYPVSAALGDVATEDDVRARIHATPRSKHLTYLKLGFAGVSNPDAVRGILRAARDAAADRGSRRIVAVAYADAIFARSAPPQLICRAAVEAGIAGILLDTYVKDGGNLLDWISPEQLMELIGSARTAGLLTAVAGGLGAEHLATVGEAEPDIVGFRGEVCTNGRRGDLAEYKIRFLRNLIAQLDSAFLQGAVQPIPT
jgi:(5-formylfuran-3-yl)methyl phosphate synthase